MEAQAASRALGELACVGAVPDLIETLGRDRATAEEAHRALVALTKQDFGTKQRKWLPWWKSNQHRPRLEWLLDGLGHDSEAIRLSSSEELRRVTGEYFGYHYDLPRREREQARQRWIAWWQETGQARFTRGES